MIRRGGRIATAVAVITVGLVPMLVATATPAVAGGIKATDDLLGSGNLAGSAVQAVSGGTGENWSVLGGIAANSFSRSASGAARLCCGTHWFTGFRMSPTTSNFGSVEMDVTFNVQSPCPTCTQNGQYINLYFYGDGGLNMRAFQLHCTSGADTGSNWRRYTGSSTAPTVLKVIADPDVNCGQTVNVRVTWDASYTYRAFVNDVLKDTYTETGASFFSPTYGYHVGFGHYDESGSSASGLRSKNFEATVGPQEHPPTPDYRCGRSIRNVGGGQYFVDLEAASLFPSWSDMALVVPPGSTSGPYSDGEFAWRTSWGANRQAITFDEYLGGVVRSSTPERITLALPSLTEMPPGGWTATFFVTRTIPVAQPDSSFTPPPGVVVVYADEDGPGPAPERPWYAPKWADGPLGELWAKYATSEIGQDGLARWVWRRLNSHQDLPPQAVAVKDPGGVFRTSAGAWREAIGTCTVNINPLEPEHPVTSSNTAPPAGGTTATTTTTTTVPGTPTTLPAGGDRTQGEDGTRNDCSAGFLGRVPIIGGLFDATARLICALKQLLQELFVPDDWGDLVNLDDYDGKFPMSWVGEGASGINTLKAQINTGAGGSACGPQIDTPEPLNLDVRFPSPAGCGGQGAGSSEAFNLFGYRTAIRATLTAFLYFGVVWRLIRLTPWMGSKDDGGPTFS